MLVVEVKAEGKCVTRNGEFPIGAIRVELSKDGKARLGFVSSRLHRNLHAGTTIDVAAMDALALEWVRRRNLGRVVGSQVELVAQVKAAVTMLSLVLDGLGGMAPKSG